MPALQIGTRFLLTLETKVFLFHILSATSKLGMCGKPKFGSDSVFKKPNRHRTVQKFDIRSDGFST